MNFFSKFVYYVDVISIYFDELPVKLSSVMYVYNLGNFCRVNSKLLAV